MSRLVAIVAAVSVLWHTTAGCCAHHGHTEAGGTVVALTAPCGHAEHDCHSENPSDPDRSPSSQCHEGMCAFALPDAPLSIDFDGPGTSFFLSDCLLNERADRGHGAAVDALAGSAPFSLGSLPRHLALGVLLL